MGGRIPAKAEARFVNPPSRLRLGGRRLFAGAHGASRRTHAGADRATPKGKKELIHFQTGMRRSAQSWKELLVDSKSGGLAVAPQAAIGDGALGFWKALDEEFPTTRHQRCWLHKTLNVLDKLADVDATQPAQGSAQNLAVVEPGAAEAAISYAVGPWSWSRPVRLPKAQRNPDFRAAADSPRQRRRIIIRSSLPNRIRNLIGNLQQLRGESPDLVGASDQTRKHIPYVEILFDGRDP